jgi:hypothetical protein
LITRAMAGLDFSPHTARDKRREKRGKDRCALNACMPP